MTCVLQLVDASLEQSIKYAFRPRISTHIHKLIKSLSLPAEERPPFKMNEAITPYVAVQLEKKASDDVPTSVALNRWIKSDILAPHQNKQIRQLLLKLGARTKPAEKAFK